jgi:hypothetical protein
VEVGHGERFVANRGDMDTRLTSATMPFPNGKASPSFSEPRSPGHALDKEAPESLCTTMDFVTFGHCVRADMSNGQPLLLSIRSTRSRTPSAVNRVVVSSATPPRATNTFVGSLIHLLHVRVVEVLLEGAEARHRVLHRLDRIVDAGQRRQAAVQDRSS